MLDHLKKLVAAANDPEVLKLLAAAQRSWTGSFPTTTTAPASTYERCSRLQAPVRKSEKTPRV